MNYPEFGDQMNRLIDVYGAKHFPQERTKLMWTEVQNWHFNHLVDFVNNWIGDKDKAPLARDFRIAGIKIREKAWEERKLQEKGQVKRIEFDERTTDPDLIKYRISMIQRRINRDIPEDEWKEFKDGLPR